MKSIENITPGILSSTAIIRFQDCDPYSHLNNGRYLDYFMNAREDQVWAAVPRDRVQVDGRHDAIDVGRVLREVRRSEASERPSVRGQEQDRVMGLGRPWRGPGRGVRPRQLEERCGAGAVVVGAWAGAAVVAVGDHDDDLIRLSVAEREQVL